MMKFEAGLIDGVVLRKLEQREDSRGWLMELYRMDDMEQHSPAMAYVSETLPGVTRGPHEHRCQADYFVFLGPGELTIHLWDNRSGSPTQGNYMCHVLSTLEPCGLIVPPGVVHAYTNTGDVPTLMLNAPDRLYAGHGKRAEVDEIRHEFDEKSPYKILKG